MSRFQDAIKTAEFKYFCYGVAACFVSIFVIAAATSSAITFTASNAIMLTPVPKYQPLVPVCPCCPTVQPAPAPVVPAAPERKKKGDLGAIGAVSMLDCVDSCKCSGKGTEGCTCIAAAALSCPCRGCSCDNVAVTRK